MSVRHEPESGPIRAQGAAELRGVAAGVLEKLVAGGLFGEVVAESLVLGAQVVLARGVLGVLDKADRVDGEVAADGEGGGVGGQRDGDGGEKQHAGLLRVGAGYQQAFNFGRGLWGRLGRAVRGRRSVGDFFDRVAVPGGDADHDLAVPSG
jgi:hypothetical protein